MEAIFSLKYGPSPFLLFFPLFSPAPRSLDLFPSQRERLRGREQPSLEVLSHLCVPEREQRTEGAGMEASRAEAAMGLNETVGPLLRENGPGRFSPPLGSCVSCFRPLGCETEGGTRGTC